MIINLNPKGSPKRNCLTTSSLESEYNLKRLATKIAPPEAISIRNPARLLQRRGDGNFQGMEDKPILGQKYQKA